MVISTNIKTYCEITTFIVSDYLYFCVLPRML